MMGICSQENYCMIFNLQIDMTIFIDRDNFNLVLNLFSFSYTPVILYAYLQFDIFRS